VVNVSMDVSTVRVLKSAAVLWFAGTFATSTAASLAHRVRRNVNTLVHIANVDTSAANLVFLAR
jgi:hypothetical protein